MKINLPNKKYNIIYADPPWAYRVCTAKDGWKSASAHYLTLSTKEICELPINALSDNGCLFLWVTAPNLPEAFKVMSSWGFVYKTIAFTWIKTYKNGLPVMGLGYWTRSATELCLLGVKGNYPRRCSKNIKQVVLEARRQHSRKPDCVRERIIELLGDLPRIELFARENVAGWDNWGYETNLFNV